MTNSHNFNETSRSPEGIPSCIFQGIIAPQGEDDRFEVWIAALQKLAEQQDREVRERSARVVNDAANGAAAPEIKPPLPKLAAGPWRSLGGYFDYTHWADRERFLELDKAIAASQDLRELDVDRDNPMF